MWPNDLQFGIYGYKFDGQPIGGRIKAESSDFKVVELDPSTKLPIPIPPNELNYPLAKGGLFLIGRVWRKGMDHSRMIKLISLAFGVKEEDVSTAGIKDARAEIVQLFSVFDPKIELLDPTQLDIGIKIDSFQFNRSKMYPGRMGGNHFDILIRNINNLDLINLSNFTDWASNGIKNYYGYQRFGGSRPITAEFGKRILNQDYKGAIDIFLGGRSSRSDEVYREHWRNKGDPKELLIIWKNIPLIEKSILTYLSKRQNDFVGAVRRIPNFLINIGKSAFISLITNHYLSRRQLDLPPLDGERENKGNIEIALPSNKWPQPLNSIWEEVFDFLNLTIDDMKLVRPTTRNLKLYPSDLKFEPFKDSKLKVSFSIDTGCYATTLLRELMQVAPSSFF